MSQPFGYANAPTPIPGNANLGAVRDIGLPRALGNLDHVTSEIEATTKALEERLQRCILPPPPTTGNKEMIDSGNNRSMGCAYAEDAEIVVSRLLEVTRALQALLRNLDV